MNEKQATPAEIFLKFDPEGNGPGELDTLDGATWRQERINRNDVRYVRADLFKQLEADRERLLQLLESASGVIGRFVSDEGWAQSDMDMMDSIDAEIARIRTTDND